MGGTKLESVLLGDDARPYAVVLRNKQEEDTVKRAQSVVTSLGLASRPSVPSQ